tara:strand:- start:2371 stop:3231 length:861 start_codon:yes stop_codon:yes gene_type:complete
MSVFDYDKAFSRNIGWVTKDEQKVLKSKKVAIAGLGGVGGIHAITLARLGIENFHIADMDAFGIENFNRQAGAMMSSIGKEKALVVKNMILDINPNANIQVFDGGINQHNIDDFLKDVDIYVDGLDFFVFDARILAFQKSYEYNIPAVSAGPLGFSAAMFNVLPGKMTFNDYFGLHTTTDLVKRSNLFLVGMIPRLAPLKYIADKSAIKLEDKAGPSTAMACQLCAGVVGTQVLKLLLGRGKVRCLPRVSTFDPYTCEVYHHWIPFGYKNPIQQLKILIAGNKKVK